MKKFLLFAILSVPTLAYGQVVTVDGKYPQLPPILGTNGGLKIECWNGTLFGNCVGGGSGGTVDQGTGGISPWLITFNGAQPVSQSGAFTVSFTAAQPVTGTFWQATQPISGNVTIENQSANTTAVAVRCVNAAGSAFESCAGAGGAGSDVNITGINGIAPSVTNPLSNRLSNGTAFIDPRDRNWTITESIPVTGTFWQATQPVSGPLTDAQLRATAVPIKLLDSAGVNQATVKAASAASVAADTSLVVGISPNNNVISTVNSSTTLLGISGVFTGTSEDISAYAAIFVTVFAAPDGGTLSIQQSSNGTNWDLLKSYTIVGSAGRTIGITPGGKFFRIVYTNNIIAQTIFRLQTIFKQFQAISVNTDSATPLLTDVNLTAVNGITISTGVGASGSGIPRVTVANDSNVLVQNATLTKGTQGTTGVTVQNLKDAGRSTVSLSLLAAAPTTADTASAALIKTTNAVAAAGTTSIVATTGKTLHMMSFTASIRTTTAATPWALVTIRMSPTTTCTVTSPVVAYLAVGGTAAVIGNTGQDTISLGDGFQLLSGGSFCISISGNVTTNTLTFSAQAFEY